MMIFFIGITTHVWHFLFFRWSFPARSTAAAEAAAAETAASDQDCEAAEHKTATLVFLHALELWLQFLVLLLALFVY